MIMKNVKSIKLNAVLNGLRSILNLIFPIITFPYISRILSVRSMGIYNFSNTYSGYFLLIAGLGIGTYAIREGAKYRDVPDKIEDFSNQMFSINILSTIVSYIVLIATLLIFSNLHNYISCILVFSLQIFFTTIGTEWLYIIYEDYTYITLRSIIFKIVSIIFLFVFVKHPNDYLIYAGITVFAGVGSNILNFIHARSFVPLKLTKSINWGYHLKPILIIFASAVAANIYVYSDNTLLGLIKNDYAVGIYSISVKIYTIAQGLLTAILAVTIPRLAMLFGRKKFREYNKLLRQVMDTLIVLAIPAATGLMMLSKDIVLLIGSSKYLPSATSLRIISCAILFSIFSWLFSDCVLIPAKREKYIFISTVVTAIFNVVVNLCTISYGSYNATALCTVLSEFLAMMMNGYYCRDIIGSILLRKSFLRNIITSIIGSVGIVIMCLLCLGIASYIIRTIASILLSIFIYAFILILLKNDIALDFIVKYRYRKRGE